MSVFCLTNFSKGALEMTVNVASGFISALLSILFAFFPPLKKSYDELEPNEKQGIMLFFVALVVIGTYAVACYGNVEIPGVSWVCEQNTIWIIAAMLWDYALSVAVNQGVYKATNYIAK